MPELAVVPGGAPVAMAIPANEWERKLELVAKTVAPGLNNEEFELFCHVARVRHLDPLQRQIHAVKRRSWNQQLNQGRGGYEEKMTIQTGIDGYRSIANRTGLYMPSDRPALVEGAGTPELRITMYVKKYHSLSGTWHEFSAAAYYREFVQTRKDGDKLVPNSMWEKMPINQLTKCAEALALRKGWPEELGGIYVDEEMQHADVPTFQPPPVQDRTQRAVGTMKPSAQPNRGHGNEGTVRTESALCAECRQANGKHADDCKLNPKNKQPGKTKVDRRTQWDNQEGHDPKVHITFDDFLQLCEIQKSLGISEADMKEWLANSFQIQHRYQISQDQFQRVLDYLRRDYEPPQEEPQTGNIAPQGLFNDE